MERGRGPTRYEIEQDVEWIAREIAEDYPRPPRGGRPGTAFGAAARRQFLPTPSARRATQISRFAWDTYEFLPTPSARRATRMRWMEVLRSFYFYPRPPRGGRHGGRPGAGRFGAISTHALREEGDRIHRPSGNRSGYFYPRPPRGGRPDAAIRPRRHKRFLPTPSARRATANVP